MKKIDSYFKNVKRNNLSVNQKNLVGNYILYKNSILLSDGYSIIRINLDTHNKNSINLYQSILAQYKELENTSLKQQIINFYENFIKKEFTTELDINNATEKIDNWNKKTLEFNDNLEISKMFYNKIINIIAPSKKARLFASNIDLRTININGKYGSAFLLGLAKF